MKNELLEEVWRNRHEFAKKWNYDIDALVAALQEMERHSHSKLVDRRKGAPHRGMQPAAEGRG